MHYAKIEAATARSLFDVHHENASLCGRAGKTGPRAAVAQEIRAYAEWLASKAGLYPFNASEVIGGGMAWRAKHHDPVMGVTYGERRPFNKDTGQHDYEPGAYSVPFPGRNAHRDKVTFETLDDDGNVIASSSLPVEPKKGGIVWDRDAVRKAAGKVEKVAKGGGAKAHNPPLVEMTIRAENPPAERQETIGAVDCSPVPVAVASGREIAPVETVSNRDELADQVAALAAMVEEMRSQLAALQSSPPVDGMMVAPPIGGKQRTAGHVRAIRAYLQMRKIRHELHYNKVAAEYSIRKSMSERDVARTKRRRAVILARDLQKRLNAEHRLVDRLTTAKREVVQDLIEARAEIATLKAKPHHMGQAVRLDDYQRLMRERDEAQASLASDREKLRQMRAALDRSADGLDMMTERALRAENALRAVEQRQDRAGAPYRVNIGAVSFRAAA